MSNRKSNYIFQLISKDKGNEGNKGGNKKAGHSFDEENIRLGTLGRSRTGTSVTSLVFETNASTNSATKAFQKNVQAFPKRDANISNDF